MIAPTRLAEVFVEVADTLIDDFDLVDFLQMVTTHTSDLADARATGILFAAPRGGLQLMAASDERTEMLELFQVQAREGPCHDCFHSGQPVVNVNLEQAADRWPRFAPRAVQAGFLSVHAFPLRLRRQVLGALNLFSDTKGGMSDEDAVIVQSLADVASIGLLQERAIHQGEVLTEQLQTALDSRIAIEQAKGALAQLLGSTPDEAFEKMRTYCRRNGLRLVEVARAVVQEPERVAGLTRP
jgi:transcriptional regulator with GAF, ATPase, and Fis domain